MKPKISVIIPVYNGEKTLRACLESVCAQEYPEYEVIVVNNNSTDATREIIEAFVDQIPQTVDRRPVTIATHGAESGVQSDERTVISSSHRATEEKEAKTVTVTVRRPVSVSVYGKALDACTQDGTEERDGPLPRGSVTYEASFGHAGVQRNCIFKTIFEPYRSRGAARNAGIKAASGEIIAMTDADCVVPVDWLSRLTEALIRSGESIAMGYEDPIKDNYWTRNMQHEHESYLRRYSDGNYITLLDTKNCAFRTAVFQEHVFDADMMNLEDLEFSLRVRGHYRILFVPHIRVRHDHKHRFCEVLRLRLNRAYWMGKIYRKYKERGREHMHDFLSPLTIRNIIGFPGWMFAQVRSFSAKDILYKSISEVAWKIGLAWGLYF